MSRLKTAAIWTALLLIFLAGLALRWAAVENTVIQSPFRNDALQYAAHALNMAQYGVYSSDPQSAFFEHRTPAPDAARTPGYPWFLYVFARTPSLELFEQGVRLAQALLSGLSILLAFALAREMLGRWAALAVAALTAFSPHLIALNTYLLSETLFTFLLLSGLWLLIRAFPAQRAPPADLGWLLLAALALTYAALTRSSALVLVPLLLLFLAWRFRQRSVQRKLGLLALIFVIGVGGWAARNQLTTEPQTDASYLANWLYHGIYPDLMYQGRAETRGYPYHADPDYNGAQTDFAVFRAELARRFSEQPLRHLWWYLRKPATLLEWGYIQGWDDILQFDVQYSPYFSEPAFKLSYRAMKGLYPLLVVLGVLGALAAWVPRSRLGLPPGRLYAARLISLLFLFFLFFHALGNPLPRYMVPVKPALYMLALLPPYWLLKRWRSRSRKPAPRMTKTAVT